MRKGGGAGRSCLVGGEGGDGGKRGKGRESWEKESVKWVATKKERKTVVNLREMEMNRGMERREEDVTRENRK